MCAEHAPFALADYLRAQYEFQHANREFCVHVGNAMPVLAGCAPGLPYALLTAWNPGSVPLERAANEVAQARLRARLAALGVALDPALGRDADATWVEPSVLALGLGLADADACARAFGQNGILAGRLGEPVRLRLYRPDWRAAAARAKLDLGFVEWAPVR
jgi:hypothetical protein